MFKDGKIDLIYSEDSDFLIYDEMNLVWKLGPGGQVDIYQHKQAICQLKNLLKEENEHK